MNKPELKPCLLPCFPEGLYQNGYMFTEAHNFFHRTFHTIKFYDFTDFELSAAFHRPVINIYKFDEWLHYQFGDYEKEGLSMEEVLAKNYGQSAAMRIKGLL